jgi:dephospho-CoA kinase
VTAYVVGLTGGIGSGKSAAAEAFSERGATVIDTDAIAHRLTAPGGGAMDLIRTAFGAGYVAADGSLDRARMRQRAFTDPAARKRLESILHPLIRAESDRQLAAATGPYALLVVPLLVEAGADRNRYDRILVVDCEESTQIARVMQRGLTVEEIRRIIASQATREARLAAADDVLENNGSIDALKRKVDALHRTYLALAAAGGGSSAGKPHDSGPS